MVSTKNLRLADKVHNTTLFDSAPCKPWEGGSGREEEGEGQGDEGKIGNGKRERGG